MERRHFLAAGLAAAAGVAIRPPLRSCVSATDRIAHRVPIQRRVCLFTDHLAGYGFGEVAGLLEQLKVVGPDLTVRPGGLVAPEAVEQELPKAHAACRERGLTIPMITTAITSARDPAARPTFTTMSRLGIRHYKLGYYEWGDLDGWETRLESVRRDLASLAELGGDAGVVAGFHNHSGPTVGGALWDSWELLKSLDRERIGFYFDPSHAMIEGGSHAWKLNFLRASSRLKMVAIKDFLWEKTDGGWRSRWCPLGEGMVRWEEFFDLLAKSDFSGPVSLHIEYDPGGSTRAERFDRGAAAAERDLAFLRGHLDRAFGPAAAG